MAEPGALIKRRAESAVYTGVGLARHQRSKFSRYEGNTETKGGLQASLLTCELQRGLPGYRQALLSFLVHTQANWGFHKMKSCAARFFLG